MSTKPGVLPLKREISTDNEIRDYAYHIYVQNGHRNDRCQENWADAKACLDARVPKEDSDEWLHFRLANKMM
jgi:Protein of unknown function (DUF2934)